MIYADMHCDSVTECCKRGLNFTSFTGQVNVTKLLAAECAAQCFAIFTEGEKAAEDFDKFLAFYYAQIAVDPHILPVESFSDILSARKQGKIAAILTVENLSFLNGETEKIAALKRGGVHMASLVWNSPNTLAYPNLIFKNGMPDFASREARGLTKAGKLAVEELNANRIIVDISHLSDGGAEDVFALSSSPVVASHSNCAEVCNVSRNLTDRQLKKIADSGGVAGLNYCFDFIGGNEPFENLYGHYAHMVKTGGEDLPALGSDFDGIPPYDELSDCVKVTKLLSYFKSRGVKDAALEKLAYKNFYRVFKDVVG